MRCLPVIFPNLVAKAFAKDLIQMAHELPDEEHVDILTDVFFSKGYIHTQL